MLMRVTNEDYKVVCTKTKEQTATPRKRVRSTCSKPKVKIDSCSE